MAIPIIQEATGTSNGVLTVVTLPSPTTAGNSLVILCGQNGAGAGGIFGITDDVGDIFHDVDATGTILPTNNTNATVDIWWCQTGLGAATTLTINATGGPTNVWVYEVGPLIVRDVAKFSDSFGHDVPVVGATLNGPDAEDIYFEVVVASLNGDITPPGNDFGSVSSPWTLDPNVFHDGISAGSRTTAYAAAHLVDTGSQTPTFTLVTPTAGAELWVVAGVAFVGTSVPTGSITISKATVPAGSSQPFTFRPSWGSPFVLNDGGSVNSGPLAVGTYSITEDAEPGWSTSVAGGSPASILVTAGVTTTLIFTNTQDTLPVCYADGVIPSGGINGVNTLFTLPSSPNPPGSLILESDSSILAPGTGFSLSNRALSLTYPPSDSLVAWYRIACGSGPAPLYTLVADQGFDDNVFLADETVINSTYFTYGFVNSAKSAQNPLLGFHRKRYQEIQINVRGAGQMTVETFPNYILKQNLSYNPSAYVLPPIVLQTDPPDDLVRPLNSVGNRVYVMFTSSAIGAYFHVSKTIMVGVMDAFNVVNPNAG